MPDSAASHPTARSLLELQREACLSDAPVTAETRRERLQRVIDMLVKHCDPLCEAMREDFSGRSELYSLMNDVLGSLATLKASRDHFESWMADSERESVAPFDQFGAKAWVKYQPKGVVGIIGTWNAPLFTLFAPLASVFAAGNRAVLKPSEVTPHTAEAVRRMVSEAFDPAELAVVTGGPQTGADFSAQAWDHLVFTGSTSIGRQIMKAASDNLVPVTLELGGKSPVLIGQSADIDNAAERIGVGKAQNSGQLCVSPDTVWVHESQAEALIAALQKVYTRLYPTIVGNADVTPSVSRRHFDRVESYIEDAAHHGAKIVTAGEASDATGVAERRRPLRIVINPPGDSKISQHEIFGTAMVLRTYDSIDEAIAAINCEPRPLALYYFGQDEEEQNYVLDSTLSGGVAINDVLMHAALEDAPFGGVGGSGMGHYHGREGFLEFSHARSVYKAGDHDPRAEWGMLPPYSEQLMQMMRAAVTP